MFFFCFFFLILREIIDFKQQISKDVIIEEHSTSDIFFPPCLFIKNKPKIFAQKMARVNPGQGFFSF